MIVKTTGAEIASVSAHRTYMHATSESSPDGYQPVVVERTRRLIDAQLQAKGYVLTENGELVVRISTGGRSLESPQNQSSYAGPQSTLAGDSSTVAGGSSSPAARPSDLAIEGALVIDILERGSKKQLVHGLASDLLRAGNVSDEQLAEAVTQILAPVPTSAR
ncbi:MAG: hypothetical protein JWP87_334 [Labilithrix sp.]|nr:hypothetical protein [Labilithrix sp.]